MIRNSHTDGTWSTGTTGTNLLSSPNAIAKQTNGKVLFVSSSGQSVQWNSGFGAVKSGGCSGASVGVSYSVTAQSDDVHSVCSDNINIAHSHYFYGNSSWHAPVTVQASTGANIWPTVSIDTSTNTVYAFWTDGSTHIYYKKSTNGMSWGGYTVWQSGETNIVGYSVNAFYQSLNSIMGVVWVGQVAGTYYVRYDFLSLSVTQSITLTIAEAGASTGTFTLSGCSVNPTTVSGDGSSHSVTAVPSCGLTVTVPSDGSNTRYRFNSSLTTWNFTTCSSGTCSAQTKMYYYQLKNTYQASPKPTGTNWDISLSIIPVGTVTGAVGSSICTLSPLGGSQTPVSCSNGWADYNLAVTFPVATGAPANTRWTVLGTSTYTDTTGGNVRNADYYRQVSVIYTTSGIGSDTSTTIVTIDGVAYTQSQLPLTKWYNASLTSTYAYVSLVDVTLKRYVWSSTSGLSQTLQSNTFTVTTGGTVIGTYIIQYDVKIQAVDKNNMATILKTSKAAMNMTTSGGSTTILLADGNGYMDFGYVTSGTQVYLTAKYGGTVVNSTWHTTLYNVSSISVYQWQFEYNAYVTLNSFYVPASQGTDGTKWTFSSYYLEGNSSATISSGTAYVYYGSKNYQTCTVGITSSSTTNCIAAQSLAGSGTVYVNMTDGYVWVRSGNTVSYGITDTGLMDSVALVWVDGNGQSIPYSYTNSASVGATQVSVTNSFVQVSLLAPSTYLYLYNVTDPYYDATANSFESSSFTLNIPTSFAGSFVLRLHLMQRLANGTNHVIDYVDKVISTSAPPAGSSGQNFGSVVSVPNDVAFSIDQSQQSQIPVLNQTVSQQINVTVQIQGVTNQLSISKITVNVPWVTVLDQLPITYSGFTQSFPLHLLIAPGVGVQPDGYIIQITVEGTVDGGTLWQPIKYAIVVSGITAIEVPKTGISPVQMVSYTASALSVTYGAIKWLRRKK
jgi:hypothetical protein